MVKMIARARPKKTVPTLVLVGQAATEAIPKAIPTILFHVSQSSLPFQGLAYVENQIPPLWNLLVLLHELCVNILKLVDLAVLLEALPQ
jgi:hypothetical protein